MLEKLFKGSPLFYLWMLALGCVIGLGFAVYIVQLLFGLSITGLSRDVSWGLYIAQFTFFGGVGASVAVVLLPAYLHGRPEFNKLVLPSLFLGIAAMAMCGLFILVDLGQPQRMLNVMLHPMPGSMMFWDMVSIMGYLAINIVLAWVLLEHEKQKLEPPRWLRPLIVLSIVWAIGSQIVEALLYQGLPGRHYWLSAIIAPRFVASAFSAGPALLLLLCFLLKKLRRFDVGDKAVRSLTLIITYAMAANVFFYLMEVFTAFYSGVSGHMHPFVFLFTGHGGQIYWINICMWAFAVLALLSLLLLLVPATRNNLRLLPWTLAMLVLSAWIDKSLGMMIGGMTPNTFDEITPYAPSMPEAVIALGVLAVGVATLSLFWKIVLDVKKEAGTF